MFRIFAILIIDVVADIIVFWRGPRHLNNLCPIILYILCNKMFYYIKYITDVLRLVDDTSRGIPFFIILTSP